MLAVAARARRPARRTVFYLAGAVALIALYAVTVVLLWSHRDFADDGPLSYRHPAATAALEPATSLATIRRQCVQAGDFGLGPDDTVKIVAARIGGVPYYACYQVTQSGGGAFSAVVVDGEGIRAPDAIVKQGGAWRWIGLVKTRGELVLAGIGLAALLAVSALYHLRAAGRRRWLSRVFLAGFGCAGLVIFGLLMDGLGDRLSTVVASLLAAGLLFGGLGGWWLLRAGTARTTARAAPPVKADRWDRQSRPARLDQDRHVRPPAGLPTFTDVGGMAPLKQELSDTLGLLLAFAGEADVYRISFNGLLLHGPPGVGKTFVARATAGEFGLNLVHVSTGDLISKYVGDSARNVKAVFAEAARHVPCLLFFDEFDSIAERRGEGISEESKWVVNQLLQSLQEWRPVRDLVIMAATNHLDRLDPAVVRAGRFDRRIRVDLPDVAARRAILTAQLARRPLAEAIDLDDLAERTAGRTPATIARVVEAAALSAFRASAESGTTAPISHQDLRTALAGLGGADRPTVEDWNWDRLILPERMLAELKQIQTLVADPDLAKAYGVEVPSGLLLAGPPGTGKTTIARVLAAAAGFSFYSQTAADLTSKWVGESEAGVQRLFARARDNAPSIIFIDEIDAIAATRSGSGASYLDRTLTQLLTEMDGLVQQRGVFVVGATNRPDILDPALVRGGRLSRTLTIPLPDQAARRRLLEVFCRRMPLGDVDLDALARRAGGLSGADLESLCQQAAMKSMLAAQRPGASGGPSLVTAAAFAEALNEVQRPDGVAAPSGEQHESGGYL